MVGNIEEWSVYVNLGLLVVAAAVVSAALIVALRPLLVHYALARPNARSSHREPTPQGGGIAVIGATTTVLAGALIFTPGLLNDPLRLAIVFASTAGLAVVGATDDIRPLEAIPRLLLQAVAVAVVIATLPAELRIIYALPWWLERALMLMAILWFVNVVNFMDGIDWMTVAEVVPVTAGLALFGLMGALPHDATLVAFILCGAIFGFAPFNRPVARLFLGDVGSLPIGLLLGWLLVLLGGGGHLAASLLLPLYYLADATITLMRRLGNGEHVLQAHRSHFYQRAKAGGLSVNQIVGRVLRLNIILVGLAAVTVVNPSPILQFTILAAGSILVGALLWKFNAGSQFISSANS
jgi:UDP-N-acetylmuramyl pentapeptide phosphotransferase/UDP-N-acetylglucosamine-1-phosphate transferase